MIKFIFKNKEETIDPDIALQASMLKRLQSDISNAVKSLACPNHDFECRATILLVADYAGYDWEILSSCCSGYKQAIESATPFPWNKMQRHLTR